MNRVTKRTWLIGLFLLALLAGMSFFLWEYSANAAQWVIFSGSPHVYNGTNLGCGTVVDRSGTMLLDITEKRTYAENEMTRKSTLHWLGDRKGYISADAVSEYAAQMVGFDPVDGVWGEAGTGGEAVLTIDASIQNVALEALAGRKGTVGIYNYKTGEILCAVTSPTYDPDNVPDIASDTTGTWEGVYLNRFLQSVYIPGSIFKVTTTAAALECVPDILEYTFTCTGRLEYGTEAVTCVVPHGTLNLQTALANSCNCSFAQIGKLVGRENMKKYVEQFGVTKRLSFDGVTTAEGNYDIADAGAVSFAWSCIGQHTDQINPARYMTFMGAIASGGEGVEPYLVSSIEVEGEQTYRAEPESTGRLMSEETAQAIQRYMRYNVTNIYGPMHFPDMQVCAKSGTSELGGGLVSNAMLAGFVMDEEYPLAFVCAVENGGSGAATCIPIVTRVLEQCRVVMDAE